MTTTIVLAIIIAALAVAVIVLAVALSAVRRDISAQRVEMYQTLQSEFSEMNRGLSDRAQEEDRRMEYLRAPVPSHRCAAAWIRCTAASARCRGSHRT